MSRLKPYQVPWHNLKVYFGFERYCIIDRMYFKGEKCPGCVSVLESIEKAYPKSLKREVENE